METLIQDVRLGIRMLRKSPAFTAVAVLSLALGIGANTAIFSMLEAIEGKTLPVRHPEQLVTVGVTRPGGGESRGIPYAMFRKLRDGNEVFSGMFTHVDDGMNLSADGKAERVMVEWVSGNFFSILGVQPFLGRLLSDDDDKPSAAQAVAVVSHDFWKRRFGSDSSLVGKTIHLNRYPFTVVGILPPGFFVVQVGFSPEIRIPLMGVGFPLNFSDRTWARLKAGVSLQRAQAATEILFQQLLREDLQASSNPRYREQHIQILPGSRGVSLLRRDFERPLLTLMTGVGLILLIACANLANLLLARATARQKEIAVRLALGAGRLRLIRQLLTESVLLSMLGGTLGLLLAFWGTDVLLTFLPQTRIPIVLELNPDLRVLAFTGCIAVLTGILCGLVPAIQSTRPSVAPTLKNELSALTTINPDGVRRFEFRNALVVFQVALSLPLLVAAGLFVRSLQNLKGVDSGFDAERVIMFDMKHPSEVYSPVQIRNFYAELIRHLEALPGVLSASLGGGSPLSGNVGSTTLSAQGFQNKPEESVKAIVETVEPRFFETVGVPLLLGRDFTAEDREGSPRVAIINKSLARHFFGSQNPIGKTIRTGSNVALEDWEIVGVVRDTRYLNLREPTRSMAYLPFRQLVEFASAIRTLHVRTGPVNSDRLIAAVRQEIQVLDQDLPVFNIKTFSLQIDESLVKERLIATLSSIFGVLALSLASVGLYGVIAFQVARRTREIGIRMALGAQRTEVLWMVLRQSLMLVLVGTAIGLSSALATTGLISSMLFRLSPTDATTIAIATLLLFAVATLAGYLPARRASRIDPMVALRYE